MRAVGLAGKGEKVSEPILGDSAVSSSSALEKLRQLILQHEKTPEVALPGERELTERFCVGRRALRRNRKYWPTSSPNGRRLNSLKSTAHTPIRSCTSTVLKCWPV